MAPIIRILRLLCLLPTIHHHKPKRRNGCRVVDWCCWVVGYLCTGYWVIMFVYSSLPLSSVDVFESPGVKLKREGLMAYHPVVFVPGFFAGELELWEGKSCAGNLFRKRVWGGGFGDIIKRPQCWMEHMLLDNVTGLDPPGVRVRAVPGMSAAAYFTGLVENLAKIGYEGKNMYMASYDWRLTFQNTEDRDRSLSRLKSKIELMVRTNGGRKVVVVPYSMGALYFLHFLKWVEAPPPMGGGGELQWCSKHVKAVMNVGPAFLGVPMAVRGIFSDEAKEMASIIGMMSHGLINPKILGFQTLQHIMHVSRTWDSMHYLLPKGGDAIWGGINLSMQEGFDCDLKNKKNVISLSRDKTVPSNVSDGKIGSWINMMVRYARIILLGKIASSSSLEIPFSDPQNLLVESTFLQMKSSQKDEVHEDIVAVARNKPSISRPIHEPSCFVAPEIMQHSYDDFPHGIADDLDDPEYSNYKYWSNPLETKLPDASNVEIYCLYGVDPPTEQSYNSRLADEHEIAPLLSAGFMCAKGWRGKTRFNPTGIPTYVREYQHQSSTNLHISERKYFVDMQNAALIEDIMRVAAGASGNDIGGDRIHSNIKNISNHVKIHLGVGVM